MLASCVLGAGPQAKLAIVSLGSLQVFSARSGILVWKFDSHSPELSDKRNRPLLFSASLDTSPDSSLLSTIVNRSLKPELLIFDANTGQVKLRQVLDARVGPHVYISSDNSRVSFISWTSGGAAGEGWIKTILVGDGLAESHTPIRITIKPDRQLALALSSDGKHVIACDIPDVPIPTAEQLVDPEFAVNVDLAITTRVLRCSDGALIRGIEFPGPAPQRQGWRHGWRKTSRRQTTATAPQGAPPCSVGFHFTRDNSWLVSFPDYTDGYKTRIVDAATGETKAFVAGSRSSSPWQKPQAGVWQPLQLDVGHDSRSGAWTRLEQTQTLFPRRNVLTLTRVSELQSGRGKGKGTPGEWASLQTSMVTAEIGERGYLSPDGLWLVVEREGRCKVDIISLGGV